VVRKDPAKSGTPLPGLTVEVHEDQNATPVAIHEITTDQQGRPLNSVVVGSSSNVRIKSADETIVRFDVAGEAREFAIQPTIVATPMVDAAGACISNVAGTPVAEFKYNNFNNQNSEVPVTDLDPALYGDPDSAADDLMLNTIRDLSGSPVLPAEEFLAGNNQTFRAGSGSYRVPFTGTLRQYFLGEETVVTSATALCEGSGTAACMRVSTTDLGAVYSRVRQTVSATLQLSSRLMKAGRSPFLKTTAKALVDTKTIMRRLETGYICPANTVLARGCYRTRFPTQELVLIHDRIFSKASPVKPKLFTDLLKSYTRSYRKFLTTMPREITYCPNR
jgi:hypothetical protein